MTSKTAIGYEQQADKFKLIGNLYKASISVLTDEIDGRATGLTESECRYIDLHTEAIEHLAELERITRTLAAIRANLDPNSRLA